MKRALSFVVLSLTFVFYAGFAGAQGSEPGGFQITWNDQLLREEAAQQQDVSWADDIPANVAEVMFGGGPPKALVNIDFRALQATGQLGVLDAFYGVTYTGQSRPGEQVNRWGP